MEFPLATLEQLKAVFSVVVYAGLRVSQVLKLLMRRAVCFEAREQFPFGFLFLLQFSLIWVFFKFFYLFDLLLVGEWVLSLFKFSLFWKHLSPLFPTFVFFLWVARNSDSKLTWSPGSVTNTSLAHELWKVPLPPKNITAPSRPPPGLTGQKPPLSTWDNSPLRVGGGWGNSDARYTPGKTTCIRWFHVAYLLNASQYQQPSLTET